MRRLLAAACSVAVVASFACAKTETKAVDSSAANAAVAPPPPAVTPADWAGTWSMTTKNMAGDSTLTSWELVATADTTGWARHMPGRPAVSSKISAMSGDSVVIDEGPWASVLVKGQKVTTHAVLHLQNGMIKGTDVAHYSGVKTADSVRTYMLEGTKKAATDTTKKMDSTKKK